MLSVSSERLKSKKRSKKMLSRTGGSKLEVLSGGKRKKKTKKTKRKKRGGEGGEVTVHFGPEKSNGARPVSFFNGTSWSSTLSDSHFMVRTLSSVPSLQSYGPWFILTPARIELNY